MSASQSGADSAPATGNTPSVGACIQSMSLVLTKTKGVLHEDIREHLNGIMRFLVATEDAESREHIGRSPEQS